MVLSLGKIKLQYVILDYPLGAPLLLLTLSMEQTNMQNCLVLIIHFTEYRFEANYIFIQNYSRSTVPLFSPMKFKTTT